MEEYVIGFFEAGDRTPIETVCAHTGMCEDEIREIFNTEIR